VTLFPLTWNCPVLPAVALRGAGIAADSVPAQEYEESKARAMLKAFELAERGL